MALQLVTLDDGSTVVLCPQHRKLIQAEPVGVEQGGKWKCRVCTVNRRLGGGRENPTSQFVGNYVVTVYPDGVWFCDCLAWRFQKGVAPAQRLCKHIRKVRDEEQH